jgi:ATP-binding cassette subfamily C (CFTR/MRP) protein 1
MSSPAGKAKRSELFLVNTTLIYVFNSLDDDASEIINQLLRSWFEGWTIIAVAHKLDSILDFDKVAVLDDGKLLEYAEPRQLLEQDSAFRRLYEISSR